MKGWRWVLLVLWSAAILLATLNWGGWFLNLVKIMVGWSKELSLPASTPSVSFHFFSYGVWAVLLSGAVFSRYWARLKPAQVVTLLVTVAAFSLVQETLQFLTPPRQPSVSDFGVNCAGSLVGLMTIHLGAILIENGWCRKAMWRTRERRSRADR